MIVIKLILNCIFIDLLSLYTPLSTWGHCSLNRAIQPYFTTILSFCLAHIHMYVIVSFFYIRTSKSNKPLDVISWVLCIASQLRRNSNWTRHWWISFEISLSGSTRKGSNFFQDLPLKEHLSKWLCQNAICNASLVVSAQGSNTISSLIE